MNTDHLTAEQSTLWKIFSRLEALEAQMRGNGYNHVRAELTINSSSDNLMLYLSAMPPGESARNQRYEFFRDLNGFDVDTLLQRANEWAADLPSAQNMAVENFQKRLGSLIEEADSLGLHHEAFREEAEQIVQQLRAAAQRISENALAHHKTE